MPELPPVAERRPARRKRVLLSGIVASQDGKRTLDCTIRDLTAGGARVALNSFCAVESDFYLLNIRDRTAHYVSAAWRSQTEIGVVFKETIPLSGTLEPHHVFLKQLWLARATR
jgi:hypothetical protein